MHIDDDIPIEIDNDEEPQLSSMPLFQTLFVETVAVLPPSPGHNALTDFGEHVVGRLSDTLGHVSAKGGNFFREREAEGMVNTTRFRRDQSMRAHLINGLLPVLRSGHWLKEWDAFRFRDWDDATIRLFMAGYTLHDFTKLPDVHQQLEDAGFKPYASPSEQMMPVLENIFRQWCSHLGLDNFLLPVGGVEMLLHDLIFVAVNTQRSTGTASRPSLYTQAHVSFDVLRLATDMSHLSDLIAYVAPDPRSLVRHKTIRTSLTMLSERDGHPTAHLRYHHVAENRGLLLNFIHDGVLQQLTLEGIREPLLYAPSGVVYLERHNAPEIPDTDTLVSTVVEGIRHTAGKRLVETGTGAKRGNVGLQTSAIYDDFTDLRDYIIRSPRLIERLIKSNKSHARLQKMIDRKFPGSKDIPDLPTDDKDVRVDRLAEWAAVIERAWRDRLGDVEPYVQWVMERWKQLDRLVTVTAMREDKEAIKTSGGIFFWWFWAAGHVIADNPQMSPDDVTLLIEQLTEELIHELPDTLPTSAQVQPGLWDDLQDYITTILTTSASTQYHLTSISSLDHYIYAKAKRKRTKACAICGSAYPTRDQVETMVAYQPGVYTSRIGVGASSNKRPICSICTLEELLRQLYMDNLEAGSGAEGQRIRYLTLYPTYFFTPETLNMTRSAYRQFRQFRISDIKQVLQRNPHDGTEFWQRLDPLLLRPRLDGDEDEDRRVLRYHRQTPATFLSLGFRNFGNPSDTEAWVLPAWMALILPLLLDVKVVASESSVPLLNEASDLPETVWLDGVHAAVREIIDAARLKVAQEAQHKSDNEIDITSQIHSGAPINIDEIPTALKWLSIAYLIHLDTEGDRRDEHWSRFPAIAHSLMESPLYVFHHLKRQERGDSSASNMKIHRYVHYANILKTDRGGLNMSHARTIVEKYRGFYRAKNFKNSNSILRPLAIVSDALLNADPRLFPDLESQIELAYGEIYRFMERVGSGAADGRFPKDITAPERQVAMRDFCIYFVEDVFHGVFRGDVSALRGKQLNLLRSACEIIYREAQIREWDDNRQSDNND
jgi:CRISPR-associated protein Csc3